MGLPDLCSVQRAEELNDRGLYELLHNSDAETALRFFLKAIDLDNSNTSALHNCGDLYNSRNEFLKALPLFETLCTLVPDKGINWYNRAISLTGLQRFEEADLCLTKAYELNPTLKTLACGKTRI